MHPSSATPAEENFSIVVSGCPTPPAPGDHRVKYPRTLHLPWSPGLQNDDRLIPSLVRMRSAGSVVVTEKFDGENTTLMRDGLHARSLDSRDHPSRAWVKRLHGAIRADIPPGWRVCGENLYALHSIAYRDLPSFFFVFNVWDAHDRCLPWSETLEWCALLGLQPVPTLYAGPWDEARLRALPADRDPAGFEGYVVRVAEGFPRAEFGACVAKWVRAGHVQTDGFWMSRPVVPNALRPEARERTLP